VGQQRNGPRPAERVSGGFAGHGPIALAAHICPFGPLTSLPFHLLVSEKPATAIPQLKDIGSYRDAAWLIKRQAVSVLPALASLKALRQVARRDPGAKPMVGFGDPVFDSAERATPRSP
jgi:hypothetical protein